MFDNIVEEMYLVYDPMKFYHNNAYYLFDKLQDFILLSSKQINDRGVTVLHYIRKGKSINSVVLNNI